METICTYMDRCWRGDMGMAQVLKLWGKLCAMQRGKILGRSVRLPPVLVSINILLCLRVHMSAHDRAHLQ